MTPERSAETKLRPSLSWGDALLYIQLLEKESREWEAELKEQKKLCNGCYLCLMAQEKKANA